MQRWALLLLLASSLSALACGGPGEDVAIVFPNAASREATNAIAVTVIEPLIFPVEKDKPELVKCSNVGVFSPTRTVDPEQFSSVPNLGRVLTGPREQHPYPFDGSWSVGIPKFDADNKKNPWGAVMVFIEARGDARTPDSEGGSPVVATLLQGCYCIRTLDGSHADRALDQAVKAACPILGEKKGAEREVDLAPVAQPAFTASIRGVQGLTVPKNQVVSPGPAVEVSARRCDDISNPGAAGQCFRCTQPCDELADRSRVPVQFIASGGGASPERQVVLTDVNGRAQASLSVADCSSPVRVDAQVLGRDEAPTSFTIDCVDPVTEFRCDPEIDLPGTRQPIAIARVPGDADQTDAVAILSDSGANATLEIMGASSRPLASLDFPDGEKARGLIGFLYDLEEETRPLIAVVTSGDADQDGEQVYVYVFEWTGSALLPQDGGPENTVGTRLSECANCTCMTAMTTCNCKLRMALQTEVTVSVADLNGDRRSDIVIGTSNDKPITTFFSNLALGEVPFAQSSCSCAQFAQPPSTFVALDIGGPNQEDGSSLQDVVIGSAGGAFLRYGEKDANGLPVIKCGQPQRFGQLATMRDFARGRFACDPTMSPDCRGYDDLVVVSAKTLAGGSFDDPGNISIIFGGDKDISALGGALYAQPGLALELPARAFEGAQPPKDPRSAEVGDLNGDGHDDLVVLYGASAELHAWLGRSAKGMGEVQNGVRLATCGSSRNECAPLRRFALADLDGDKRSEVIVVCGPTTPSPRLRRYVPVVPGR